MGCSALRHGTRIVPDDRPRGRRHSAVSPPLSHFEARPDLAVGSALVVARGLRVPPAGAARRAKLFGIAPPSPPRMHFIFLRRRRRRSSSRRSSTRLRRRPSTRCKGTRMRRDGGAVERFAPAAAAVRRPRRGRGGLLREEWRAPREALAARRASPRRARSPSLPAAPSPLHVRPRGVETSPPRHRRRRLRLLGAPLTLAVASPPAADAAPRWRRRRSATALLPQCLRDSRSGETRGTADRLAQLPLRKRAQPGFDALAQRHPRRPSPSAYAPFSAPRLDHRRRARKYSANAARPSPPPPPGTELRELRRARWWARRSSPTTGGAAARRRRRPTARAVVGRAPMLRERRRAVVVIADTNASAVANSRRRWSSRASMSRTSGVAGSSGDGTQQPEYGPRTAPRRTRS